ncbi:hypothetical protein [Streptomyces sp. ISID311]|uniref:hypothetical protein n=1 Tax=Streptomyces sp. ISID311 TaxID=2601673 RepID=UPI0011BD43DC|nr:hypothetical protein [Streptomyces sp. ISID311]TXC96355.1 hypothetical protein FS847_17450 [Streptomyces sp. ISID311]
MRKTLAVAAVCTVCTLTMASGRVPTITTQGTGWNLTTRLGVTSLSPSRPYTVTFATAAMKARYTPYLTAAVAQAKAAGVRLAIGGVETVDPAKCGPVGHVQITEMYRPLHKPGYSQGMPCPHPAKGVGVGGIAAIDSEYFDGSYRIAASIVRNTVVHETLHALGLDHPNYDMDKDGVVEKFECVATPYGNKPIMCEPNGGYRTAADAGKLTGFDLNGLKALLANARVQGIK